MFDATAVTAIVGAVSGVLGACTGILGSVVAFRSISLQRKQTEIMEAGLEKAIEVKITKEFDAPDVETSTGIESKLRAVINRRLRENRAKMKEDLTPHLERIERTVQEYQSNIQGYDSTLATLTRYLKDQKDIEELAQSTREIHTNVIEAQERVLAETGRYSADIAAHGHEIEALQSQLEGLQNGIRTQIRMIAQHLLDLSS